MTCRPLITFIPGSFILYFRALTPAIAICPSSCDMPPDTPIASDDVPDHASSPLLPIPCRPGNRFRNVATTARSAWTEKMFTGENPRRQAR